MRVVKMLTKVKTQRRAHCFLVRMIIHCLLRLTFSCPANMDVLASRTKYDHTMRSVLRYFKDAPQVEALAMNLLANWFAATDEENRVRFIYFTLPFFVASNQTYINTRIF